MTDYGRLNKRNQKYSNARNKNLSMKFKNSCEKLRTMMRANDTGNRDKEG